MTVFKESWVVRDQRGRFAKKLGDAWKPNATGETLIKKTGPDRQTVIPNTAQARREQSLNEKVEAAHSEAVNTPISQGEKDKMASFAQKYDYTASAAEGYRVKGDRVEADVVGVTYGGLSGKTKRAKLTVSKPIPKAPKGAIGADKATIANAAGDRLLRDINAAMTTLNNAKAKRRKKMDQLVRNSAMRQRGQ